MIRGNWSLAAEIKKNERKSQQKIQHKQKHQHSLEKLSKTDPIRLYYQIQKLESNLQHLNDRDSQYLKSLKQDFDFIQKNKLHQEKLKPFLENLENEAKREKIRQTKLWGQKSIYFNPELNPLGKVPTGATNLTLVKPLPNKTIQAKGNHKLQILPSQFSIAGLEIVLPVGEPPKFYKLVQNTTRTSVVIPQDVSVSENVETAANELPGDLTSDEEDNEDKGQNSDDDDDYHNKRQKLI